MNGQLPAPASGVNFFNVQSSPSGGTYHFIVDQQPETTVDAGNHSDINYPPMIDATTAKAGHTYQVSVALGNPLINGTAGLEATVALDFTLNAGTYYEPSNTNSYNYATGQTNPPQPGDTSLDYSGYGTTVASAFAYGDTTAWALAARHIPDPHSDLDLPSFRRRHASGYPVAIRLLPDGGQRIHEQRPVD